MGFPLPLNTLPNMSSETASFIDDPEKAIRVAEVSTPVVPSNTCRLSSVNRMAWLERGPTHLHDCLFPADFQHLASSDRSIGQGELNDLIVGRKLDNL